jgi:hypothetical protein
VSVIVKLEDSPLASYEGTVPGLPATSPRANGKDKLDLKSPESARYRAYLKGKGLRRNNFYRSVFTTAGVIV